jgi:tRNA A37 threonylcarbamoyladenosine synthetase subunit TsaC/SUA5/YrdC
LESLSIDAQVVVKRLLPGPLALAVRPSPMTPPWALLPSGLSVLSVPADPDTVQILRSFGLPLLCFAVAQETGEDARYGEATVLDVTARPARIIREGLPSRTDLERYILMEGPDYPRREQS